MYLADDKHDSVLMENDNFRVLAGMSMKLCGWWMVLQIGRLGMRSCDRMRFGYLLICWMPSATHWRLDGMYSHISMHNLQRKLVTEKLFGYVEHPEACYQIINLVAGPCSTWRYIPHTERNLRLSGWAPADEMMDAGTLQGTLELQYWAMSGVCQVLVLSHKHGTGLFWLD